MEASDSITSLIPHRPPFLLIDEIVDTTNSAEDNLPASLTARFTPRADMPLFANIYPGHYPDNPVTPGVLLCEIIFQAGALLMSKRLRATAAQGTAVAGTPVITRIRDARFRRMVKPGEVLDISVNFEEQLANAYYLGGAIKVGGETAVKTSFTCALV